MATDVLRSWLGDSVRRPTGCVIIGEVALAHDGSLGTAHAYIDAIARAGADAVKFQTHIAAAESTAAESWRVSFSRADASRYDYWKRMEFTESQWAGLKLHAESAGLLFLSSPFSTEAMDLLQRVGMAAWKVASGELGTAPMLDAMIRSGRPLLISTGMSSHAEIDELVARLRQQAARFALLQCTTAYPCPPERVGLNLLSLFRSRYHCPVGLSDHSGTIYPGVAAATLGADVIEVHVTLSRECFGPDVCASVTTGELATLVEGVRLIERMLANPVDKDREAQAAAPARALFRKSIVARVPLTAGTVLRRDLLAAKKPGTGIPADRLQDLTERRLRRDVAADELIRFEDLEPAE
jgi:N,N'-diacetyllegionaminate synthase